MVVCSSVVGPTLCTQQHSFATIVRRSYPMLLTSIPDHHADTKNSVFVIASGAILGVGAAFLWIAQGDIMIAYPAEHQKGRAIGLFWLIFNLGGSIGGFMSFGLNFHSKSGTVSDSTCMSPQSFK